jgi:plastocyanin
MVMVGGVVLGLLGTAAHADDPTLVSVSIVDTPRLQANWGFAPREITVAPGAWVTWSNDGYDAHTVTAADASFDSGELQPSEGFSWYFDQPGTYEYICQLHPWMKGRISVVDPNAGDSSA